MAAAAWVNAVSAAIGNDNRREAGETVFYALLAVLNSPAFLDTLPVEMDDFFPGSAAIARGLAHERRRNWQEAS